MRSLTVELEKPSALRAPMAKHYESLEDSAMSVSSLTRYFLDSGLTHTYPATGIDGNPTGDINYKFIPGKLKCRRPKCGQQFQDGDVAVKTKGGFRHEVCPGIGTTMRMIARGTSITDRMAIYRELSETNEKGCWLWTGSKSAGYADVGIGMKVVKLHKLAWEWVNGPVPDGLELDHLCRNRACWNPDHVEPVTHKVNMERGAHRLKTHCPQGHPYDEINTRFYRGRRYCWTCIRTRGKK